MDFPRLIPHGTKTETGSTGTSVMTVITSSASTHTKGAWTQLIASTAREAFGIIVQTEARVGANSERLIDIGIGAASSEIVLIPDIMCPNQGDIAFTYLWFPIRIPQGSRLAARSQSSSASQASGVNLILFSGGFVGGGHSLSSVEAYGENAADSGGTSVDPGTTANTKGVYSELIASTSKEVLALGLAFGVAVTARTATANWLLDVAIGAASSEIVVISNIALHCDAANDNVVPTQIGCLPIQIPVGSRIAVRAQCDITTADRTFDIIAYGVS